MLNAYTEPAEVAEKVERCGNRFNYGYCLEIATGKSQKSEYN